MQQNQPGQHRPSHPPHPPVHLDDDPTQAIESGDPQLTGKATSDESQPEPLKKHGDKLNPHLPAPESGRHGATPQ